MMERLDSRGLMVCGILVAASVLTAASFLWYSREGGASELSLDGVSLDLLAEDGFTVTAPRDGYAPRVSSDDARDAARIAEPDVSVKQVLLAHVRVEGTGIGREVWIVNLDPDDPDVAPPRPEEGAVKFVVAFVDADTGEHLYTLGEQEPPPGGPQPLFPDSRRQSRLAS